MCVCAYVCVNVCACVCVRACACVCVQCESDYEFSASQVTHMVKLSRTGRTVIDCFRSIDTYKEESCEIQIRILQVRATIDNLPKAASELLGVLAFCRAPKNSKSPLLPYTGFDLCNLAEDTAGRFQ